MHNYRLYIDESGHHRYKGTDNIPDRYLGLTGIIVRHDVYESDVVSRIESLRKLFYTDYDMRPPLHLTDIIAAKNSFSLLKNPSISTVFNEQFLQLLRGVSYKIITCVIDKNAHQDRYVRPEHPYHYVLACILERYVKYLINMNSKGDVMVEARGKKEDQLIRNAYENFYRFGTTYAEPRDIQQRITSGQIKLKTKEFFVQGLEFADLLALSSKYDVLHTYGQIEKLGNNFTSTVIASIQSKYYSGSLGVKGNGKKYI